MNVEGYYQPKVKPGFGVVAYEGLIRSKDCKNTEEFVLKQKNREKFDIKIINYFSSLLSLDKLAVSMAINIFSNSFYSEDFIRSCEDNVKKFRFSLEVTEYEPILNLVQAREAMLYLSSLGIEFSLDDFGKGYSNLRTLKQFPFHEVKLDRALVNRAVSCKKTRESIKTLKSRAIDSGIERIVYEGIESQRMENMILDFDSTAILQGYFYSMPKPISDLVSLYDN
ncbi:EAL domain-containing protein [Vibrio owensii]|uniref:EAL domain-containing protein n=1 Tax=Vibrio owensii TaxID=696485 RepID=UPI003CE44E85